MRHLLVLLAPACKLANWIYDCSYSMLAHKGNKSEEAAGVINFLKSHEWGVMILDEVC